MKTRFFYAEAKFEMNVNAGGECHLVIYGRHANGGFCAVVSHGKSCEMSTPDDTFYNVERLTACGFSKEVATAIATEIKEAAKTICEEKSKALHKNTLKKYGITAKDYKAAEEELCDKGIARGCFQKTDALLAVLDVITSGDIGEKYNENA